MRRGERIGDILKPDALPGLELAEHGFPERLVAVRRFEPLRRGHDGCPVLRRGFGNVFRPCPSPAHLDIPDALWRRGRWRDGVEYIAALL